MSRDARNDLDVRVRRAWPIDGDAASGPLADAQHVRALINERIVGGAGLAKPRMDAPARHTGAPRGRRRLAALLIGAVLVTSALVLTGLVAGRLRLQEQPDNVEFADKPQQGVADEPTARGPKRPDVAVPAALAATRRALDDLTMTKVAQDWINREKRKFADADAFAEQVPPHQQSTAVDAANGDWSYEDHWDVRGSNTHLGEPGDCDRIADCVEPFGAMRSVGGEYYERAFNARTWEQVVADGPRSASQIARNGLALELIEFERRTVIAVLEDYGGSWTVAGGGPAGHTGYLTDDAGEAHRIIEGILAGRVLPRAALRGLGAAPAVTTVEVWVDDASGLVQRVRTELRSTKDITKHTWLLRHDIRFTYGAASPVAAPEQATDVTLSEWCARLRRQAWCEEAS